MNWYIIYIVNKWVYYYDFLQVRYIVNYDFFDFVFDYIYRCGRVGRIGLYGYGTVISFIFENWEVELFW